MKIFYNSIIVSETVNLTKYSKMKITILIFFAISVKFSTSVGDDEKSYRLPNAKFIVDSYDLKIIPHLIDDFTFDGEESIKVKMLEETKCVTMNSKNLVIKEIAAFTTYPTCQTYQVFHKLLPDREMLELCFTEVFSQYTILTISISFMGKMRDDFKGLYKVQYEDNGSKRWVAATVLEPTYARMVFPCFDEPQYAAKFLLSIARHSDQKSISVTELRSTTKDPKDDNRLWDTFRTTVPCAPYMMSFSIYSFTSRTDRTGVLSVNSKKHKDQDVKLIISDYSKWYNKFAEFLDINYFDPYLDIVALPDGDEFSQTATMMVYKEKDVLHVEGVDVEKHEEEIARASIHKIYHLWIGGYVRLYWWSDTWLSESFGIYFQYVIAAQLYPKWGMVGRFITEVLQEALLEEEIHPNSIISSPTKLPSDIQSQKFNSFINKKGASIIYMLQQVIGYSHLQNAITNSFRKCRESLSYITRDDLWDAIDREIANENLLPERTPVKNFMQTWFQNSGFPLITVLTNAQGEVVMKQEMYDASATKKYTEDYNWIIPVICKKNSLLTNPIERVTWLQSSTSIVANYKLDSDEWILCNLKQGYYRVTYSNENWLLLIKQLKSGRLGIKKIDNFNRAQLIDDSFNLAAHNKLSFSIAFKLGEYLEKEVDMLPWLSFTKYITYFLRLYEDTDVIEYLKRYFSGIIKHQYKRIGFEAQEKESYAIKTGRPYILAAACKLELADCLEDSSRIYKKYSNDLTKIPPELKYVVYSSLFKILEVNQSAWNQLWKVYKNSQSMSEKELVLSSLASVNDKSSLKRYLEMTISSDAQTLYYFEKEYIIKSSIGFYNGVTAVLEILEEMIPKFRFQSELTKRTLIFMANKIQFNIVSLEHIEKAKQIIARLENDEDEDTPLMENLRKFIDLGTRKMEYKMKNSDEIKKVIHDITGYTMPTNTTQPSTLVPSGDCRMAHLMTQYLLIIVGLIFITV